MAINIAFISVAVTNKIFLVVDFKQTKQGHTYSILQTVSKKKFTSEGVVFFIYDISLVKKAFTFESVEIFRIFTKNAGNFEVALEIFLKSSCKIRGWCRKVSYKNFLILTIRI